MAGSARHGVVEHVSVIPRACGVSSTPRLIDLIIDASGILGHPLSRVTTTEYVFAISRRDCARGLHEFCPSEARGRREDRVRAAPAVSCARCTSKNAHEHTGSAEAFRPSLRNGFNGFLRALVSAKSARMCERAVLAKPPVAGSEPVRAQRPKSLSGSEGQIRCLPQPEQLHGLRARTEQGRELDDGTKRSHCRRYRCCQG